MQRTRSTAHPLRSRILLFYLISPHRRPKVTFLLEQMRWRKHGYPQRFKIIHTTIQPVCAADGVHGKQQEGNGWVLYILALESEPREQFRTNQEGRSKPEEETGGEHRPLVGK